MAPPRTASHPPAGGILHLSGLSRSRKGSAVFPIAHVWLLERLLPDLTPAHCLGCVWPDMLFGSPLSHFDSHQRGDQLLAFARAQQSAGATGAAEFSSFVAGALTHGSVPHGFDWYSDERYGDAPESAKGYAFQRGRPLAAATAAACHLPPQYGAWKAHNVVEMACDLALYAADHGLGDRFATVLANQGLITRIAAPLAEFFDQPAALLAASMSNFGEWWTRPESPAVMAHVYARQVRAKHGVADPDEHALAALIERAGMLVAPDRDAFLDYCVAQVGQMLRALDVVGAD